MSCILLVWPALRSILNVAMHSLTQTWQLGMSGRTGLAEGRVQQQLPDAAGLHAVQSQPWLPVVAGGRLAGRRHHAQRRLCQRELRHVVKADGGLVVVLILCGISHAHVGRRPYSVLASLIEGIHHCSR